MADPLPLLCQSEPESHQKNKDKLISSVDEVIEQNIGGFGWAQLVQAILVSLASFFDSQQSFISVFTDAEPTWHCTDGAICNSTSNICQLPKSAWTWDHEISSNTIISEWGLECSSAFIKGLPAASHFMGSLLGVLFLATLADSSLGRKNLLFLSCLTMSITTCLTILSNKIWAYSFLRFVCGVGRSLIGGCTLVLLTEKVGRKWRGLVEFLDFTCFVLGILSLSAIAYINQASSWRNDYLFTSIPTFVYCAMFYFFVSESPRWLLMQGREEEATATFKKLSPLKDVKLRLLNDSNYFCLTDHETSSKFGVFSPIKDLFQRKWAVRRTLALMVVGFGIAIVYYGMTLGIGDLGFDIYLGLAFNALLQLPSNIVILFLVERCNRKSSLMTLSFVSGICNILITAAGKGFKGIQIALHLASFFVAATAYGVLLNYALELFPTCIRSSSTSMVRQAINLGSVVSSVLAAAGRSDDFLLYGVSGLVIMFCGLFVVFLPETRNAAICDTMDEQERQDILVV